MEETTKMVKTEPSQSTFESNQHQMQHQLSRMNIELQDDMSIQETNDHQIEMRVTDADK